MLKIPIRPPLKIPLSIEIKFKRYLTDTGLEKKVRYRTEVILFEQCRRLPTAHYLAVPDCIFYGTF